MVEVTTVIMFLLGFDQGLDFMAARSLQLIINSPLSEQKLGRIRRIAWRFSRTRVQIYFGRPSFSFHGNPYGRRGTCCNKYYQFMDVISNGHMLYIPDR